MIDGTKNFAAQLSDDEDVRKLYQRISDGFRDKQDQSSQINNNWDIWNCKLNTMQTFQGDSQCYVPAVRDCIEARVKRIMSTVYPPSERHIRAVSESGDNPLATIAMLDHHMRMAGFKEILPGLLRYGDIEGQWSLYVDWYRKTRKVIRKFVSHPEIEEGVYSTEEEQDDAEEEELLDERPDIWVIPAQDLCVLPATVERLDEADWIIVALRESKDEIKKKVKAGIYLDEPSKALLNGIEHNQTEQNKDAQKERAKDAGVKVRGKDRYGLIWQAWGEWEIEGERRPVVIHFGGENAVLGVHKNPYWCQIPPVISSSPIKVPGSFFGTSKVTPVAPLQYQLNDMVNMGQDSAIYSVQQIVMTDPNKNPRLDSMMLARGAVWLTSPQDTQFAEFPPLWQHAAANSGMLINQIKESMDVNDAMLARPGSKKNVKQQAAESMEAMAAINDTAKNLETSILDPLLERIFEYDQQFRDKEIAVYELGEMGEEAKIEQIPPAQAYKRYYFKWIGTETQMGIQRMQQKIAAMNILKGVPPNLVPGKRIDLAPIIEELVDTTFSPTVGRRILFDMTKNIQMDPEMENEMMLNGLQVHVHPEDDDKTHIASHQAAATLTGDQNGMMRMHMQDHLKQAQMKLQQGMQNQPPQGPTGAESTLRQGAQPGTPRTVQQPPGAISSDRMMDPTMTRQ